MSQTIRLTFIVLVMLAGSLVYAQDVPVVHGILFFSPTCPHCDAVINTHLPPMQDQYGAQLDIRLVDVSQREGAEMMIKACTLYTIPAERCGSVPTLILGDVYLIGSLEIPNRLPQLIEDGLAVGGVALPELEPQAPEAGSCQDYVQHVYDEGNNLQSTLAPIMVSLQQLGENNSAMLPQTLSAYRQALDLRRSNEDLNPLPDCALEFHPMYLKVLNLYVDLFAQIALAQAQPDLLESLVPDISATQSRLQSLQIEFLTRLEALPFDE